MRNIKTRFFGKQLFYLFALVVCYTCLSCSEDEEPPIVVPPVEEPVEKTFDGKYVGGWWSKAENGSVYENIAASAIIKETANENQWVGEFFYTRNHISCCSADPNDGEISFTLIDGVISDFLYFGTIPNCGSDFRGEGEVTDEGKIIITLTSGRDCEGEHTDG